MKIEKIIEQLTCHEHLKQELMNTVNEVKTSSIDLSATNGLIVNVAKQFLAKNGSMLEASNVIPSILMQKQGKIVDFLIDTKVFGTYCLLAFVLAFNWMPPLGIFIVHVGF